MKLIFNKDFYFSEEKARDSISDLIDNFYNSVEKSETWNNVAIWNEVKNSFSIEGDFIKYQIFTYYLNLLNDENFEGNYFFYKRELKNILNNKISIDHESIYKMFINLGNAVQLKIGEGFDGYYRKGDVYLTSDYMYSFSGKGLDHVNRYMDNLLLFVNDDYLSDDIGLIIKSFITHLQFVNIHPYYDCNGRIARLLNIWVAKESKYFYLLQNLSQSIMNTKLKYYKAIENSINKEKISLNTFIDYMVYALLENNRAYNEISKIIDIKLLTQAEKEWAIILFTNFKNIVFGWRDVKRNMKSSMSKQGLINLLNRLTQYKLLDRFERKNAYFYRLKTQQSS